MEDDENLIDGMGGANIPQEPRLTEMLLGEEENLISDDPFSKANHLLNAKHEPINLVSDTLLIEEIK